jgi:uncharacterized protein YbjT (DUF2867 family)
MILVTGASGTVGGQVLAALLARGAKVRAMYRAQEDAGRAPAGVSTAIADFGDVAALRGALDGVQSVYLVCSPVRELVQLESNMIDACVAAGVGHVVLNSALGAENYDKSFPAWHRKVEDKLKAKKIPFTILRPNSFMQNVLMYFAPTIRTQNAFYSSVGDSRTSFIDVRDIAAAIANIFVASGVHDDENVDRHKGKTYELNGPEALTYAEVAEKISRAARRTIRYVDIPEDAQRQSLLGLGMPSWQVEALLELQQYYRLGVGGGDGDGVLRGLLRSAPRTMDEFLAQNKDALGEASAAKV